MILKDQRDHCPENAMFLSLVEDCDLEPGRRMDTMCRIPKRRDGVVVKTAAILSREKCMTLSAVAALLRKIPNPKLFMLFWMVFADRGYAR